LSGYVVRWTGPARSPGRVSLRAATHSLCSPACDASVAGPERADGPSQSYPVVVFMCRYGCGAPKRVPSVQMSEPNRVEDTGIGSDRFERKQIARDCDAARPETADMTAAFAQELIDDLIDAGVITPVPDREVFVHEPSGEMFRSRRQIAAFHRGWATARTGGGIDQQ